MSASALFARIDGQLSDSKRELVRPMAALAVRFSGRTLAHAGRAASAALELVVARAPASAFWRGVVTKDGGKATRHAKPQPIGKRKPVTDALARLTAMPPRAFELYVQDGSTEQLAPDRFGAWLGLAATGKDTFAAPRGFLAVGVPLEELERPAALLALGDQLVELLEAEAAWLGPAVWLAPHCLFNSASNELPDSASWLIELFGRDPQLDAPHLYASRWPHASWEVKPDLFSGLLAPSWTMWLDARLASKVTSFPGPHEQRERFARFQLSEACPFEMDERTYAAWRAGWQALAPVHLACADTSATGRYFRERLAAASHAELLSGWRAADEEATAAARRSIAVVQRLQALAEAGSPEIVDVAVEARGIVEPGSLCWWLLPALTRLISAGAIEPAVGVVWLDYGEEAGAWRGANQRSQATMAAAALAVVADRPERAIALVREAHADARGELQALDGTAKRKLARDPRFTRLRKHAAWKELVG